MKKEYMLNHYQFHAGPGGIFAEGRLHGRPGYPEGVPVQTSSILSYSFNDDCLLIRTANSIYRCPLSSYISESRSVGYLAGLPCAKRRGFREDGCKVLSGLLSSIERERMYLYKDRLKVLENDSAIIRYHGCDSPYVEWIAVRQNDQIVIHDSTCSDSEINTFPLLKDSPFSIICSVSPLKSRSDSLELPCTTDLYIENSGERALFFYDSSGTCRTVESGKILPFISRCKVIN